MLAKVGGWPVLLGSSWNESASLSWQQVLHEFDIIGFHVKALVEGINFNNTINVSFD